MKKENGDQWAAIFEHLQSLFDSGLRGDELADQLLEDKKSGEFDFKLGLHDMFNVSDEEEASWYDMSSRKIRSFDELISVLQNEGFLDARVGYIREAMRTYSDECREFFAQWLTAMEEICDDELLGEDNFIEEDSLITFESVCYFAAEYHITEFFEPIMNCLYGLHRSEASPEYTPLFEFVYQHLGSVIYAIFDGNFDGLMDTILDLNTDDEIRKYLAFALTQFVLDGVLPQKKQDEYLDQFISFILENDLDGEAAAQWIVRTGQRESRGKELQELLDYQVDFMMFGTTDPVEFEKMVLNPSSREDCQIGLVMDDMILNGMYTAAIHCPKEIRKNAINAQYKRIRSMREQFKNA